MADCGPGGEYVTSGRKEAFDTCLRAHVDELAGRLCVGRGRRRGRSTARKADTIRAADAAAAAAAATNSIRAHKAAADAFFRDPPGGDEPSDGVAPCGVAVALGDGDQDRADALDKGGRVACHLPLCPDV